MESTLPRALMAVLAGAAFGVAGCAFQVMLRNPLASPDVLGITLGASAGAVIAVVVLRGTPVTVAALVGAVLAAALIRQCRRARRATGRMVVVGVALAAGLRRSCTGCSCGQHLPGTGRAHLAQRQPHRDVDRHPADARPRRAARPAPPRPRRTAARARPRRRPRRRTRCAGRPTAGRGHRRRGDARRGGDGRRRADRLRRLPQRPDRPAPGPGRPAAGVAALVGAVVVLAADYVAAYGIPGTALPVGVVTGALGAPVLLWMLRSRPATQEGR